MNYSYWEIKSWLSNVDYLIVGSGIVGLTCALNLKLKHPNKNVLILEKGMLPEGASTKNAGFACFGSLSELIDDLDNHSEEEVYNLVKQRWDGLSLLRRTLGDDVIGFENHGGYELFRKNHDEEFQFCRSRLSEINKLLWPLFKDDVFKMLPNPFGFKNIIHELFYNPFESQIDTGRMMNALLSLAQSKGIKVLNNVEVKDFSEQNSSVILNTNAFEIATKNLIIATNGFAAQLLSEEVKPARAQVLITKPIDNLKIKGTFHLEKGYYYFRNIDDRILFGGGRNLDFKTEETTQFGQTEIIQSQLETYLKEMILPEIPFEVDHRWSGIMGVGSQKKPIVKKISEHVVCGVRLGGMGIAIGSTIGKQLADLTDSR